MYRVVDGLFPARGEHVPPYTLTEDYVVPEEPEEPDEVTAVELRLAVLKMKTKNDSYAGLGTSVP